MENFVIQFPIWDIGIFGGGFLVAVIASFHVFIAHFAVGGGLFLVLTELKGYRENSDEIISYTRSHSRFFMITTLVAGAVTGVAIWFVIGLLNPSATSFLINTFVFAWASEWVFFLCEIISIFLYYYYFGRVKKETHILTGVLYFVFSWLSLFFINGIISFMLTPGDFINTGNFWDGFFNPGFFSSLFFRTALALMLAGLFGLVTSTWIKEEKIRISMVRFCVKWVLISVVLLAAGSYMYLESIPSARRYLILENYTEVLRVTKYFTFILILISVVTLFLAVKVNSKIQKSFAVLLLVAGLAYISSFEMIREAARRPFILQGIMYSNSVTVKKENTVRKKGILASYRWRSVKDIKKDKLKAGKELFDISCGSCHSNGGYMNDIRKHIGDYSKFGLEALLTGIGKRSYYMPEFMGTKKEKKALAEFLFSIGGNSEKKFSDLVLKDVKPYTFDYKKSGYVLLSWTDKGMNYIPGKNEIIKINDTIVNIHATLIKRGSVPENVMFDVKLYLRFEDEKDFYPFEFDDDTGTFLLSIETEKLRKDISIYRKADVFALKKGQTLKDLKNVTKTSLLVPVSNETSCYSCHNYSGFEGKVRGISKGTALKILKTHDRLNNTSLHRKAKKGGFIECKECHDGSSKNMNLSASIHGFHSIYMKGSGSRSCNKCHSLSTEGQTKGFRGIHNYIDLECINCHGTIEEVALPLLLTEKKNRKKGAEKLIKIINNKSTDSMKPRNAWINEPDCLFCHVKFNEPERGELEVNQRTSGSDNLFSRKQDDAGIMCGACHGSQHSLYPEQNKLSKSRGNLQPKQYQNNPYPIASNKNCKVCHKKDMKEEMHHPNSLRYFRNTID